MDPLSSSFFIFYALAIGIFFLAQLYGFVISQTRYSETIEEPKFRMLEQENLG